MRMFLSFFGYLAIEVIFMFHACFRYYLQTSGDVKNRPLFWICYYPSFLTGDSSFNYTEYPNITSSPVGCAIRLTAVLLFKYSDPSTLKL